MCTRNSPKEDRFDQCSSVTVWGIIGTFTSEAYNIQVKGKDLIRYNSNNTKHYCRDMLLKQSGDIIIGFICILTPESKQHSKINFGLLHIFLSQGAWYIGPQLRKVSRCAPPTYSYMVTTWLKEFSVVLNSSYFILL
jgi:hypothetical protein